MNATASGMLSDMPIVNGLGPRDDPTGMDVVLKVTLHPLSDRVTDGIGLPCLHCFESCNVKEVMYKQLIICDGTK